MFFDSDPDLFFSEPKRKAPTFPFAGEGKETEGSIEKSEKSRRFEKLF